MRLTAIAISVALISGLLAGQGEFALPDNYQLNSPQAHLDVNRVVVTNCAGPAAKVFAGVGTVLTFTVGSVLDGMPYEIAITPYHLLSASDGAFVTMGGQILHVSPFWPGSVFWSTGGPATVPQRFPGNFSVPFTSVYPALWSAQMVVVDPMNPEGFVLSQASEVEFLNMLHLGVDGAGVIVTPGPDGLERG